MPCPCETAEAGPGPLDTGITLWKENGSIGRRSHVHASTRYLHFHVADWDLWPRMSFTVCFVESGLFFGIQIVLWNPDCSLEYQRHWKWHAWHRCLAPRILCFRGEQNALKYHACSMAESHITLSQTNSALCRLYNSWVVSRYREKSKKAFGI